jgi:hypothetical protein
MKKEEFRKQDYQPIELHGKTAVTIGSEALARSVNTF